MKKIVLSGAHNSIDCSSQRVFGAKYNIVTVSRCGQTTDFVVEDYLDLPDEISLALRLF